MSKNLIVKLYMVSRFIWFLKKLNVLIETIKYSIGNLEKENNKIHVFFHV